MSTWKLENLGESVLFIPNASILKKYLTYNTLWDDPEMSYDICVSSYVLPQKRLQNTLAGPQRTDSRWVRASCCLGGCGKWKTFGTLWQTLLAFSRLKCLKPNGACVLNNSEIMWCNLQMSELWTECYHLLRSKEAGLRDLDCVLWQWYSNELDTGHGSFG